MALKKIADKIIETDVLVLGGGIGGCPAAAKAAENGLNVTLIEKSKPERSGKAAQGLDEIGPFPRDGLTTLDLVKLGLGRSAFINPNALYKIYNSSLWAVEEMERLGVTMKFLDGKYCWMALRNFTSGADAKVGLRVHWQNVKPEMAAGVRKRGVKVVERTMVVDLLTNNNKVVGATAVNTRTGEFIVVKAKAVVIATGDFARHYNPSMPLSWKYKMSPNTCPASSSGDGLAVAYRAGADLTCMEMMTLFGIRDLLCIQPGQLYLKEAFASKAFTWMGEEIAFPRGPLEYMELVKKALVPPYQSFEHLPEDFHKVIELHSADETMLRLKLSQDRGFNPISHRYEIPANRLWPFGATGIIIDEDFKGSLKGLYAVGECSDSCGGGGGSSTAGFLVGNNIQSYVSESAEPVVDEAQVESQKQAALAPLAVKDGVEPMELECAIRYICDEYGGMLKSEGKLREGLRRLGSLRRVFMPKLMATNPHYLMRCLEVRNIMEMAELHLQASLERKETRGQYVRLDYPERDSLLDNKRICQRMAKGKAMLEIREVPDLKPEYAKEKKKNG